MKRMWILITVLCFILAGCIGEKKNAPFPEPVQVVNPILVVETLAQMEEYLDFSVPVLEREVQKYIVLVIDGYPQMGRVCYADGGEFRIQYGTGDISGIYGGIEEKTENIHGVQVTYFTYGEIRYAIWGQDGFACCFTGGAELETVVAELIE